MTISTASLKVKLGVCDGLRRLLRLAVPNQKSQPIVAHSGQNQKQPDNFDEIF